MRVFVCAGKWAQMSLLVKRLKTSWFLVAILAGFLVNHNRIHMASWLVPTMGSWMLNCRYAIEWDGMEDDTQEGSQAGP